jgi:endonuclease/exonuclease/phosphatase family metal-dependent hydrolase
MTVSKGYRAATYNVHGCIGTDGRHSPERVAQVINELDADVIALQEVSTIEHDGKTTDQLAWLAERTGYMSIAGPTLSRGAGPFGNAILTRHAPLQVHRHDLSVPGFEPRGALDVNLDVDGVDVRLVATHLGLRARERQRQVALLLDAIEHRSNPLILLGDFNEWFPKTAVGRRLSKLGEWSHPRTYPSFFPIFALDRIWTFPIQLLERPPSAHRSALARTASDHLPLVADLATIGIESSSVDASADDGSR